MPLFNYHIECPEGSMGSICLLPGDPGRVEAIARLLDDAEPVANHREYNSWRGRLDGKGVSVMSTGIGGPSTAIAVEELYSIGVRTFIRVGTSGGMADKVRSGDLVIGMSAVRQEGTALHYAPVEYPATADFGVTLALQQAAERLGYRHHVGVVHCKDSFYGQHSPERSPVGGELLQKWQAWLHLGVLASEMESATLFTVAASLGARAGAVLHVVWNQERKARGILDEADDMDVSRAIRCAVEAARAL